ncbi:uncharacterized protein LOC124596126 [Schistocerca americana]|uniref:uncharacterized protein LOC124596126 n=1 Tax=Schistocerca americana TaxID=7009 RepID=UPI001F4FEACF|nr:uncharacterized protein LOC124596126 [Schistocerca americana]
MGEYKKTGQKEQDSGNEDEQDTHTLSHHTGGGKVECVKSFNYLGSIVSCDGSSKLEVLNRIRKCASFFHQVQNLIWDKEVPQRTKQTMSALQKKTRRNRVRNDCVRRDLQVTLTTQERMSALRLKWFGHMKRMHPTRTPCQCLEMEVPERRPIGQPRKRWTDQAKEDFKRREVTWDVVEREKLYQDRNQWRHIIHQVPTRLAGRKS